MPTNRITVSGRRVLEDKEFFYVPVDAVPPGADLGNYLYIPSGTAGMGGMGGFFKKIKKKLKGGIKKLGGVVKKAGKLVGGVVKKPLGMVSGLVGGLTGGMMQQGVPQEAAQGMAQGIAAENPDITPADIQRAAELAAAKYRDGGGEMSAVTKVGIGAGVAVGVIGLLGIVYLATRRGSSQAPAPAFAANRRGRRRRS